MPDPRRTARRGIGLLVAMGVPRVLACRIAEQTAQDAAACASAAGAADVDWLLEVARLAALEAASGVSRPPVSLRAATWALVQKMDALGYEWSPRLGQFTGREQTAGTEGSCERESGRAAQPGSAGESRHER